jgi:hypothetical protein
MRIKELHRAGPAEPRQIHPRIFNPTFGEVRCGYAEDADRVSRWPTEPPSPTEPMPSRGGVGPSGTGGGAMRVMGLGASRPSGDRTHQVNLAAITK